MHVTIVMLSQDQQNEGTYLNAWWKAILSPHWEYLLRLLLSSLKCNLNAQCACVFTFCYAIYLIMYINLFMIRKRLIESVHVATGNGGKEEVQWTIVEVNTFF